MKFNEEKKKAIIQYILEKIEQGNEGISKTVSEVFSVNQNTVHTYINELTEQNIIKRVKRGMYELSNNSFMYELNRKNGDLDSDDYAFNHYFYQYIKDLPMNVREIWSYTFSEMINNVMDHSNAEEAKLVIEQNYLETSVMIVDKGVGIFEKIKDHFGLSSLEEAICELFKGKLTTDSTNHSGEGIFFSSKLMDDFYIISSGKIFSNNKYDNSKVIDLAAGNIGGTCVLMSLSNHTQKRSQEVFNLYANEDGGFIKTKIPMKNLFEVSPVSRSQAKRVCNRLEKFKEVVIDFDGLEWMGQGFAHQLFVVFAKQNPDIKLLPINMNEEITKMYTHVITAV